MIQANTIEYFSPDFHRAYGRAFLVLLFALVASWILMASGDWRPTPQETSEKGEMAADGTSALSPLALALGVLWTALALESMRFVALWAVVMIPILGAAITACLRTQDWKHLPWNISVIPAGIRVFTALNRRLDAIAALDRKTVGGLWATLGVAGILALVLNGGTLPGGRTVILDAQFDARTFPVAAADRLARDGLPHGNGFTTYNWGSYLDYALPAYHPFVDSRTDAYSARLLQQYLDIVDIAPGLEHPTRPLSYCLGIASGCLGIASSGTPLAQVLALRHGWTCRAADNVGVAILCQQGP